MSALTAQLRALTARLADVVGINLVGIYLYGSLARGCHSPHTSDVDLLMVTREPCSDPALAAVAEAHAGAGFPVDLLSVTRAQIGLDVTPTPFDFAVMAAAPGAIVRPAGGKGDLLLIRQDVYDCDSALAGEPTREVVRSVPWPLLAQSLEFLFPHIVPRFKNPALMLCRVVYAFANRVLCSKQTAGEWALDRLDPTWQPVIQVALDKYRTGAADNQGPNQELQAFEQYCTRYITSHSRCIS